MGVIRPPWISEEWFNSYPFNYCDHFGDKKLLAEVCKICREELEKIEEYQRKVEADGELVSSAIEIFGHFEYLKINHQKLTKKSLELADMIRREFFPEEAIIQLAVARSIRFYYNLIISNVA